MAEREIMNYYFEIRSSNTYAAYTYNLDIGAHLHEEIEAGYIISGSSEIYIEDKKYFMTSGDFYIAFPNQIHRYENSKNLESYITIFSPQMIPEFNEVFSKKVPESPVIKGIGENIPKLFTLMYSEYKAGITAETTRGFILAMMGMLMKHIKLIDLSKCNVSALKNVLLYCNEHYTEPVTIEMAADSLHISRSHLAHIFKERLNTTFGKYIAKKRIERACEILRVGEKNITETAAEAGFESVRTFNRTFAEIVGISPREYCKKRDARK